MWERIIVWRSIINKLWVVFQHYFAYFMMRRNEINELRVIPLSAKNDSSKWQIPNQVKEYRDGNFRHLTRSEPSATYLVLSCSQDECELKPCPEGDFLCDSVQSNIIYLIFTFSFIFFSRNRYTNLDILFQLQTTDVTWRAVVLQKVSLSAKTIQFHRLSVGTFFIQKKSVSQKKKWTQYLPIHVPVCFQVFSE